MTPASPPWTRKVGCAVTTHDLSNWSNCSKLYKSFYIPSLTPSLLLFIFLIPIIQRVINCLKGQSTQYFFPEDLTGQLLSWTLYISSPNKTGEQSPLKLIVITMGFQKCKISQFYRVFDINKSPLRAGVEVLNSV